MYARDNGVCVVMAKVEPTNWIDAYMRFERDSWSRLRGDWELSLNENQLAQLRGLNEPLSLQEVTDIYLPLCRLLDLYIEASGNLHRAATHFLGASDEKVPFVLALAGSVAAGKSTTARTIKAVLEAGVRSPSVQVVATDGFLYPNSVLLERGLMERKGFPESYNRLALLNFLVGVKSGQLSNFVPTYSHVEYDIVARQRTDIGSPDIVILEGLNVLQPPRTDTTMQARAHISQFIDFSIYLDAQDHLLEQWYIDRFLLLRDTAFQNPRSFFRRFGHLSDKDAIAKARCLWRAINLPNLKQNILPTRYHATAILRKGNDHAVENIALRRL